MPRALHVLDGERMHVELAQPQRIFRHVARGAFLRKQIEPQEAGLGLLLPAPDELFAAGLHTALFIDQHCAQHSVLQ